MEVQTTLTETLPLPGLDKQVQIHIVTLLNKRIIIFGLRTRRWKFSLFS